MQNDKLLKSLVVSVLLHSLLFVGIQAAHKACGGGSGGNSDKQAMSGSVGKILAKEHIPVEVQFKEVVQVDSSTVVMQKHEEAVKSQASDSKTGYFGIGVTFNSFNVQSVEYNNEVYMGIPLEEISPGNAAWNAGLLTGDLIFLVNGQQAMPGRQGNIVGDAEKDITLGLMRNGRVKFVKVRTKWVRTEGVDGK